MHNNINLTAVQSNEFERKSDACGISLSETNHSYTENSRDALSAYPAARALFNRYPLSNCAVAVPPHA